MSKVENKQAGGKSVTTKPNKDKKPGKPKK